MTHLTDGIAVVPDAYRNVCSEHHPVCSLWSRSAQIYQRDPKVVETRKANVLQPELCFQAIS